MRAASGVSFGMEPTKLLLTEIELSRQTGVPITWLRREAKRGTIPYLRVGRSRMFSFEQVAKVLTERATMPDRRDNMAAHPTEVRP